MRDSLGGSEVALPVDKPDVIDMIGTQEASGEVVLTISDHLEWDEANEHLLQLQEKINRYLAFIEAGELPEKYPASVGKKVRIQVFCKYAPSFDGERLLDRARETVEGAGFLFSWRVLAA